MRPLPTRFVVSLWFALALGLQVGVHAFLGHGHVGRYVTGSAATLLVVGAAVALLRARTWGLPMMLVTATGFFVAGALDMGPRCLFFKLALFGALPFALAVPYLARRDRVATVVLTLGACSLGLGAAVGWHALAPAIIPLFGQH